MAPSGLALTAGSATSNGGTFTWTATSPAPSNGYQYYFSTSATPPNGATTPSGTSASASATINTMTSGSTNYVWVRSDCGGSYSSWTGPVSVTTLCAPAVEEYFNFFDQSGPDYIYTAPAIQPCHSIQNAGAANNWYTTATPSVVDGFYDEHLEYNAHASQTANAWWYTTGVTLTAGKTYQLSYLYGGSTNFSFLTNKMEVKIGSAPYNSFMTTLIDDHPNIKHGAQYNYVNFTVPSSGTYYLGFHAYSAANMGKIFLDEIQLVEGICIQPTGVTVTSLSATAATIIWNAPTPAPAGGYAYYLSTSPTPPGNNTTPTGFTSAGTTVVNLPGLTGNTGYYFWVRGNCNAGDYSMWSAVTNFTTPVLPPYCFPTTGQTNPGYISNVTTTNAVANINNSSAWTSPGNVDYTSQTIIEAQGGSFDFSVGLDDGVGSAGIAGGVGVAVFVDWNNDGDFVDAGEQPFTTLSYTGGTQGTVTGTVNVPGGATLGVKRMRVLIDWNDATPAPCVFAGSGELEDYSIKVVVAPPPLTLSSTSQTQCAGTTTASTVTITSGLGSYDTFTWSPAGGVSGTASTGYTFNNGSTVTYTLTATQTSGDYSVNTAQFTYVANALPTPITITSTPTGAGMCQGGTAVQLTASGGVVSGLPILSENFNSGAPGWTTVNNATGGTPANSAWTIRPDGFAPLGPSWFGTIIHSNDASSFMFSDSDSQGIGSNTNNELISPVFSLAGFTAASLSFWHFYRQWTPSTATVEISTNGGGTYTQLPGLIYTNVNQGANANFAQVVADLGAYLGQTNLRIRFKWVATWGWGWAIDNFLVSGNATSAITWSPTTGLFTDALHTNAYTGGGTTTVYAWPNTTTTYTASASTPSPVCSTTTTQAVTVTPIVAGTISSDQNVCSGNVTNIVLTGQSGTIATWQSSTNPAFSTPTNIPGSAGATTLTGAMLGPVNATTYIRVQITNGTCTFYTNTVTLTVDSTTWTTGWSNGLPTAGKRVVFNGNYTSTGDINACSVAVISGNVSIQPGHSLIVENQVNVTGGQLIFESDASLVQISDAAVNTGAITYKRETTPMRVYDYTYWSAPLSGMNLDDVSPDTRFDKYHQFNVATGQFQTIPDTSIMTPGRGYIMRAPDGWPSVPTVFTSVMTMGPANNGVITYPVSLSAPATNLNLLGNPYPSALDADDFLTNPTNAGLINGTIYFWTHNTGITNQQYNNNDYASYNLLGGTAAANLGSGNNSAPTKNIAAGNSFFATATANGSVVFNNSMRLAGSNDNFYRPAAAKNAQMPNVLEKHRIWLNMTGAASTAFKQTLVGYVTNATVGMDRDFDGDAIESMNSINFYSLVETTKLTIQGRPLPFDTYDQVPMGYRANVAGTYSIAISSVDGLFADDSQNIYLEDLLLGTIHDLKSGAYSFATATGEVNNRFVLRFTTQQLQVGDPVFNTNSVIVFEKDDVIHINSGNAVMDNVKIFDTRGRLVFEKKNVGSTETEIAHLGAADQVLIVQVTSVDGIVVNKKIIH
ncbi:T9SS sorting signal type C domain-containing protein [Flavobacterium sp. MAH-1]|uniref:T9SS sorting signal type C domain-containing protein n=1 Tax=Flavobacterium agri TaxID=2743471 RepID=A0A7Y8Y3M3_9FLAO|nr:GEVED domain-containing protein [Flavobacterium agri]NUY81877.1 T9SS sorting signal type C domain-containing protein [Flavobacterium agri]NYA71901.1 T9SS sorting signal type C domain-containing protein [Flavobacterium agri]